MKLNGGNVLAERARAVNELSQLRQYFLFYFLYYLV